MLAVLAKAGVAPVFTPAMRILLSSLFRGYSPTPSARYEMTLPIQSIELPSPEAFEPPALALEHLAWLKLESARHNLTSVAEEDWLIRHVMDSLVPAFAGWEIGGRFLDLGTGGGFPGIPLAARFPQSVFTLLEKKKKTVRILNKFLEDSSLSARGEAVGERAENLARDPRHRGVYDTVVVRALATLPVLIELGVPFLKMGGELWVWKSDLSEIENAAHAFSELKGAAIRALQYQLPDEETARYVIAIRRLEETPDKYPRREGAPAKKPL